MKLANLNGTPEIFHTLQGEGRSMGMPSVFIRLSLCNLHCIWCDTDYTWNWKGTNFKHVRDQDSGYSKFSMKEMIVDWAVEKIVPELLKYGCPNFVITGGEPLMQQEELAEMLEIVKTKLPASHVEIETNGTIIPEPELAQYLDQFNVSPKLSNSGNKQLLREKPDALHYFASDSRSNFKFVIDTPQDLEEVQTLIASYAIPAGKVYLMPQGTKQEELTRKRTWLAEVCKTYNLNYTDRMHIHLYGNKRGV
jgi:7-carboxy-7-deazaguanine synthase